MQERDIRDISLLCRYHWKEGIPGEKRPKDRVKIGLLNGILYCPTEEEEEEEE